MPEIFNPPDEEEAQDLVAPEKSLILNSGKIKITSEEKEQERRLRKEAARFVRKNLVNEIKRVVRPRGFDKKGRGSTWLRDCGEYYQMVYLQKSYFDSDRQMTYKVEIGVISRNRIKDVGNYFNEYRVKNGKLPVFLSEKDIDTAICDNEDRFELGDFAFVHPLDEKEREKAKEMVSQIGQLLDKSVEWLDNYSKERNKAGFPRLRSRADGPVF